MTPAFAVVGHPNKGKSSIVATLAQNDSIEISSRSGTTKACQRIQVFIGEASYELIDTPGFQRPTKVLAWLQAKATTADKRTEAVAKFLSDKSCQANFPDEVELLTPIMDGAAILYVVDGSRPYGSEFDAEMEILRWTGQASVALINPIENEDYVAQWQNALQQYFKVVRVFNAMEAEYDKHLAVLQALSHIRQDWKNALDEIVEASKARVNQRKMNAANLAASLLTKSTALQITQKVLSKEQADLLKTVMSKRYFSKIEAIENQHHGSLKSLHAYHQLESHTAALPQFDNLFDTEKWIIWGLTRQQLTTAAAMAGAAAGVAIDIALAGTSLLFGAMSGGAIGAVGAWLGSDKLAESKLEGLPLGGYVAIQGPMKNRNFPYVLLGRFLHLEEILTHRTHAQRTSISIEEGKLQEKISRLNEKQQRSLHKALGDLSKQKTSENLSSVLLPLFP
ncbi:MAG: GTPase Era involved in 16S rRNA processing [Candidatus Azotimanducaceae bacterium]|jgi:GTPase Era involved in 16S rRNA processing